MMSRKPGAAAPRRSAGIMLQGATLKMGRLTGLDSYDVKGNRRPLWQDE